MATQLGASTYIALLGPQNPKASLIPEQTAMQAEFVAGGEIGEHRTSGRTDVLASSKRPSRFFGGKRTYRTLSYFWRKMVLAVYSAVK